MKLKRYSPKEKIYLSQTTRQAFFGALHQDTKNEKKQQNWPKYGADSKMQTQATPVAPILTARVLLKTIVMTSQQIGSCKLDIRTTHVDVVSENCARVDRRK